MGDKAKYEAATAERAQFEAWIANPYLLDKKSDPDHYGEYDHPWTRGAWAAWLHLKKEQNEELVMLRKMVDDYRKWLDEARQQVAQHVQWLKDARSEFHIE